MLGLNSAVETLYKKVLSWPVIDMLERKHHLVKVMSLSQQKTFLILHTFPFQACHVVTVTRRDDPQ